MILSSDTSPTQQGLSPQGRTVLRGAEDGEKVHTKRPLNHSETDRCGVSCGAVSTARQDWYVSSYRLLREAYSPGTVVPGSGHPPGFQGQASPSNGRLDIFVEGPPPAPSNKLLSASERLGAQSLWDVPPTDPPFRQSGASRQAEPAFGTSVLSPEKFAVRGIRSESTKCTAGCELRAAGWPRRSPPDARSLVYNHPST